MPRGGLVGCVCGAIVGFGVYAVLRCCIKKKHRKLCELSEDKVTWVMVARQDNGVLSYRSQAHVYGSEEHERMVLLAVRFYHYTYLRYKYIYEDAAEKDDDPPCMCGEEGNKCPCAAKRF